MAFDDLVRVGRDLDVNNIALANYTFLDSLPYLMRVLSDAGLDEASCASFSPRHDPVEGFTEVLEPARMKKSLQPGHRYLYDYAMRAESPGDVHGGASTLELLEDGHPLGPAHSPHKDIAVEGGGRWSHWGNHDLWFSTSDNSDPRTNGRKYVAEQR